MRKPRLLDLFCGAGGASVGYVMAGFDVVGVDINRQPRYPYLFVQSDALEFARRNWRHFDAIHASPPCQAFTRAGHLRVAQGKETSAPDLIEPTRELLISTGLPFVIENVPGAPVTGAVLCGTQFGLGVYREDEQAWRPLRRHRIFESNVPIPQPPCNHKVGRPLGVYGSMRDNIPQGGQTVRSIEEGRELMGIDWMIWTELKESIPPAYTEHVGWALRRELEAAA